jgi:Holliday junction resolvase-like predicted endonuclease
VARNVQVGADEIDLVMAWGPLLVAVEVKTRVGGDPADQFTAEKARRFRRAGRGLRPPPGRYDLVAVRLGRAGAEVRWLPGAG